jgi:hypothetical protein
MSHHPQVAFADAVNSLAARFAASSAAAWDSRRCASEAEAYWREAIRRGWRLDGDRPVATSAVPLAADVLADSRQRLAHGEVPADDARAELLAAVKAAVGPPPEPAEEAR